MVKSSFCVSSLVSWSLFLGVDSMFNNANKTFDYISGVDVSSEVSESSASCFASNGLSFVVPRAFRSSGVVDTAACTTLTNSMNAGIPFRHVYMFPCPTCTTSAAGQMETMVDYLKTSCNSSWSGAIWLDIEGSQYWTGSYSENQAFYQDLVDACISTGYGCGIYASMYQWEELFGSSTYVYGNELPLWYAHYDNNPTFSDYSAFGGWTTPAAKQYEGTTTYCGASVDLDVA
mmetsp:Transcript_3875/g.5123  ORF Transcript_3875/g.5123 Transcript_3875/m.5123 type:complete len:232 (+) Transcript_3875:13-708(+)